MARLRQDGLLFTPGQLSPGLVEEGKYKFVIGWPGAVTASPTSSSPAEERDQGGDALRREEQQAGDFPWLRA